MEDESTLYGKPTERENEGRKTLLFPHSREHH